MFNREAEPEEEKLEKRNRSIYDNKILLSEETEPKKRKIYNENERKLQLGQERNPSKRNHITNLIPCRDVKL